MLGSLHPAFGKWCSKKYSISNGNDRNVDNYIGVSSCRAILELCVVCKMRSEKSCFVWELRVKR
jgi:hypothetical protein